MRAVRDILAGPPASRAVVLRAAGPGDWGWIVSRHGALYAAEYGWDESFEALVARIVADHIESRDPRTDAAWIAELDGEPAGCVLCVREDERTAKLRLLLVDPRARGLGIGGRLVEECIRFARRAGYARLVLWTNAPLTSARRIYEAAGFVLTGEEEHESFGSTLTGQTFSLEL
jgi:GNAT superfamily N-acetyltransferase